MTACMWKQRQGLGISLRGRAVVRGLIPGLLGSSVRRSVLSLRWRTCSHRLSQWAKLSSPLCHLIGHQTVQGQLSSAETLWGGPQA